MNWLCIIKNTIKAKTEPKAASCATNQISTSEVKVSRLFTFSTLSLPTCTVCFLHGSLLFVSVSPVGPVLGLQHCDLRPQAGLPVLKLCWDSSFHRWKLTLCSSHHFHHRSERWTVRDCWRLRALTSIFIYSVLIEHRGFFFFTSLRSVLSAASITLHIQYVDLFHSEHTWQ